MGKTSKSRLPSSSDHSFSGHTSKHKIKATMSLQKTHNKKKKSHTKTRNNIKKLFDVLRNESNSSIVATLDNSIFIVEESSTPNRKRKLSDPNLYQNCKRKNNNSLIIINDDNDSIINTVGGTPKRKPTVSCSTPLNTKNSKSLQSLHTSPIEHNFTVEVNDLTRQINRDSYVTIDLTTETLNSSDNTDKSKMQNTVIDLANATDNNTDCTLVSMSISNASLSMSGDSDVTVLRKPTGKPTQDQMQNVFDGISKLNPNEKSKMLEYVMKQILNGCNVPENAGSSHHLNPPINHATDTAEDTYIKEVILGQTRSRNSVGSNIYNPESAVNRTGLRMVVIDGSNVAMEHGRGKVFSVEGLRICIDYFVNRGHVVKAFVPRFRCRFGMSTCPSLLDHLERRGLVVYTPSRKVQGKFITSYDDRYIVQCAAEFDGVIVSGDNYRDLLMENPRWRHVIENRLLQFTFVQNMIMFPKDPLGRNGPTLEELLRHPPSNANKYTS